MKSQKQYKRKQDRTLWHFGIWNRTKFQFCFQTMGPEFTAKCRLAPVTFPVPAPPIGRNKTGICCDSRFQNAIRSGLTQVRLQVQTLTGRGDTVLLRLQAHSRRERRAGKSEFNGVSNY
jgi:hypothetical protein